MGEEYFFKLKEIKDQLSILSYNFQQDGNYTVYYGEFIKLLRCYFKLVLKYPHDNKQTDFQYSNCYFYALDLPMPELFAKTYAADTQEELCVSPGVLGGYLPLQDYVSKYELIYRISSDLIALGIPSFKIKKDEEPSHMGYKIAVFLKENGNDYHFIREQDGNWVYLDGYKGQVESLDEDDFSHLTDESYIPFSHIRTLEIVKPKARK